MRVHSLLPLLLLAASCDVSDDMGYDPDYCPAVADWDESWAAFESDVATLVNQRRSEGGVCGGETFGRSAPLATDTTLRCAARNHSLDMSRRDYFDHESPEGDDLADRLARAGYEWTVIGENIARGQRTPTAVMESWMESPGHCANVLDPRFGYLGVGYVADGDVWTQVFARP